MIGQVYNVDAWASPEGWDCNQKTLVGGFALPDECKNEDVIEALYEGEFITTKDGIEVEDYFNGYAWCVEVRVAKTGEPLYVVEFALEV